MDKEDLKKIASLGGKIKINKEVKGYYFGDSKSGGSFSKEKLFGISGPLHPGMANHKGEMAVESVESDTQQDLIRELTDKGLTREEAVRTIETLLKAKILVETFDSDLGKKVLVFRR